MDRTSEMDAALAPLLPALDALLLRDKLAWVIVAVDVGDAADALAGGNGPIATLVQCAPGMPGDLAYAILRMGADMVQRTAAPVAGEA